MMPYGVTYQDVLNLYIGSVDTDYGGIDVINREFEFAVQQVNNNLHPTVLRMLDYGIVGVKVTVDDDGYITLPFPSTGDLYLYAGTSNNACRPCVCCDGNKITKVFTTEEDTQGIKITNYDGEVVYANFMIDVDNLELTDLGMYVRAYAACVLGSMLYSKQSDEWRLVDRMCKVQMPSKYIPNAFKSASYLNYPFGGSATVHEWRRG